MATKGYIVCEQAFEYNDEIYTFTGQQGQPQLIFTKEDDAERHAEKLNVAKFRTALKHDIWEYSYEPNFGDLGSPGAELFEKLFGPIYMEWWENQGAIFDADGEEITGEFHAKVNKLTDDEVIQLMRHACRGHGIQFYYVTEAAFAHAMA